MTRVMATAAELADAVIETVGKRIVLGLPVGIGKAVHVADALFARAAADSGIQLSIFSGLTLEVPRGRSELEQRFLEPFTKRMFADWPTPEYARAIRARELPANIEVREYYLRPGAWLGNAQAQQNYASINYSQVVDALRGLGVNVIAQLVASRAESPGCYSLGSNPEVTLDLLPHLESVRACGGRVAMVGQVNPAMPYMTGDAEVDSERFDLVLDSRDYDFPLFPLPNRPVAHADYAAAMHVASLVRDGGTLQIGIGSLSDAVAHCLRLRHEHPDVFKSVLEQLPGGASSPRRSTMPLETGSFETGLYSSTELLSDALYSLFEHGIVRRPAETGVDAVIHAGFFIGSGRLYRALADLAEVDRRRISMTRISFTNTLYEQEASKRRQRTHARFINETMLVTLLGAAVSDSLDDGRVVSGVGGQFDFVSMGHQLDDAQSILMVRARRMHKGRPQSNIRWSYAEATVPRHHRDVFVSEYGVAATRGLTDRHVIAAMLDIADSEFQQQLQQQAVSAAKLPEDHRVSADAENNTSEALRAVFERDDVRPWFPTYPLGTELTAVEQQLAAALGWLDRQTARAVPAARTAWTALRTGLRAEHRDAFKRLGLGDASGIRGRLLRRLVNLALLRNSGSSGDSG